MTLTFHWWHLSIFLFLFPFVYRLIKPYKSSGGYMDIDFGTGILILICWPSAVVFTLTKLFEIFFGGKL